MLELRKEVRAQKDDLVDRECSNCLYNLAGGEAVSASQTLFLGYKQRDVSVTSVLWAELSDSHFSAF